MCRPTVGMLRERKFLIIIPYFDAKYQDSILNPQIEKIAQTWKLGDREKTRVYSK